MPKHVKQTQKKPAVKEDYVEFDDKTDKFSLDEQKAIVKMILRYYEDDIGNMSQWLEDRQKDIEMYEGAKPSLIENLDKMDWMSDRNLGLTAATCDMYQATLLATCYNPDTIHFVADENNDIDNKENLAKFTKWGLSEQEADFFPQIDDFIHNRITQGVSYFYEHWEVKYEWVDRRIPKYRETQGERTFIGYDIQTEHKRFERGVIENIPDVSDLVFPAHGSTIQEKHHVTHVQHKFMGDVLEKAENKEFINVDDDFVRKIARDTYSQRSENVRHEKMRFLGISESMDSSDPGASGLPVELYYYYGPYEKNGKKEEYRFIIEPTQKVFLSGKPLRKITRSGKRPFVGGSLIRRPGFLQGKSIPRLTMHVINQINNIYNQKADFQFMVNCPFGFYNPDETQIKQIQDIAPGKMFPFSDPKNVLFPNLSRSMSWGERDLSFLMEVLERLTGAASYFQSRANQSKTLGQDVMIQESSETRFGLWVKRIIDDISEAITMWIQMYQDWSPPDLGDRVLGEDGRKLFKNLSIETLRGAYRGRMVPDIIGGSKTLEREIALWGLNTLQNTMWFHPQVNPKGNWELVHDTMMKVGYKQAEQWMPPKPQAQFGRSERLKEIITELKQGTLPELKPADDPMEIFAGLQMFREERIDELDEEYHENLNLLTFQAYMAVIKQMRMVQEQQMANNLALQMATKLESRGFTPRSPGNEAGTAGGNGKPPVPKINNQAQEFPLAGN